MKKYLMMFATAALMTACSKPDLSKVQKGMTEAQVVSTVGEPDAKTPMPMGITWWMYGDNSVVIVQDSAVVNVSLDMKADKAKMQESMDEFKAMMDSMQQAQ